MIDEDKALRNLGNNVRMLLGEKRLSQNKLAEITGIPAMTVSTIVNAKYMPAVVTVARIAEALRTSVDYLLADHSEEISAPA